MAKLLKINTFNSEKGELSVLEDFLPGGVKRVYYIKNVPADAVRGGHRHKLTKQVLVTISGNCRVETDNGFEKNIFELNSHEKCLILDPEDWHIMNNFSNDCILLVLANQVYDVKDYIDEPYYDLVANE